MMEFTDGQLADDSEVWFCCKVVSTFRAHRDSAGTTVVDQQASFVFTSTCCATSASLEPFTWFPLSTNVVCPQSILWREAGADDRARLWHRMLAHGDAD